MMKISIVMAYHNRRLLLTKTLESLTNTKCTNFEVIVVDDASDEDQRIEHLQSMFKFLKVFRIEPSEKWWRNPCIPNNIGFSKATGDVVVIQNPECLHIGDILYHIYNNWKRNRYLVYGCYAIDQQKTEQLLPYLGSDTEAILSIVEPTNNIPLDQCPHMNRWYQHSEYSPRCFNFCTAIGKKELDFMGGFDDDFADGIGYDDTEFIARIKNRYLDIIMVDEPMVIHQWHPFTNYSGKNWDLHMKNKAIYENKTLNSREFQVTNLRTKEILKGV